MVPIALRTRGSTPPSGPIHYAVTADGIFEVRDTELYRSETRATLTLPGLERGSESLELRMPALSASVMRSAVAFFAAVNRLCGSEGMLILFYDPRTRSYRAEAPVQTVKAHASHAGRYLTSLAVSYGVVTRPAGHLRCGSIHSHADVAAFASGTDCADELEEDGLHVVVGDLGKTALSLSAAFVVAGRRFAVSLADVIEPFDARAACSLAPPPEWLTASTIEFIDGERLRGRLSLGYLARLAPQRRGAPYDVTTLLAHAESALEARPS